MSQTTTFPVITVSGAPYIRGASYGEQCADRIKQTLRFYRGLLPQGPARIEELSRQYLQAIRLHSTELSDEITGLAKGAGVSEEDIALLNARSELLGGMECTSVAQPSVGLLGQTWDWCQPLEELAVVLRLSKPNGTHLTMLVEPGMLGKIGMNGHGIGVCINFLSCPSLPKVPGLPFHVLARLALEKSSLEEAQGVALRHGGSASGHLLIGSGYQGTASSVELAGPQWHAVTSGQLLTHANRYVRLPVADGWLHRLDSQKRAARMEALSRSGEPSLARLQANLLDRKGWCPINGKYWPTLDKGKVGTVATVAMDLKAGKFTIRKGNGRAGEYVAIAV